MAKLYLTEYADLGAAGANRMTLLPVGMEPGVEQTPLAIGTEIKSAAFADATRFIRVHVDAICSVVVGDASVTATTSNKRMAANQTEYWGVKPGHKLSVITNT